MTVHEHTPQLGLGWKGRNASPLAGQSLGWGAGLESCCPCVIPNLGSPRLRNASYHDPELAKILINASDKELKFILVINRA